MIHPADECRDHKFGGDNNDGSPEDIFTNCESIEGLPSNSFITISAFRGVTNELEKIYEAALVATEPRERKRARAKLHGLLDRHVESVNTVLGWRDPVPNVGKDLSDALLRFRRETDDVLDAIFNANKGGDVPIDRDKSLRAKVLSFGESFATEVGMIPALQSRGSIICHMPSLSIMTAHLSELDGGSHVGANIAWNETAHKLDRYVSGMLSAQKHIFAGLDGEKMFIVNEECIGRDLPTGAVVTLKHEDRDLTVIAYAKMRGRSSVMLWETIKPGLGLKDMPLTELRTFQASVGDTLVSPNGIDAALLHRMTVFVHDFESEQVYTFSPE
jgi:hypothetical protein